MASKIDQFCALFKSIQFKVQKEPEKPVVSKQTLDGQNKEKVLIENTLTVVDDLALPIDKIRLRKAGTHAGHNGLKDIQAILGSDAYAKLRFGIGDNYPKGMQADFVLSKWLKTEEPIIKLKIETCIEIIENFIIVGIDQTMSKYNNLVINP